MPPLPRTQSVSDLQAELADLKAQVQQTRRERLHLTSTTPNPQALDAATVQAQQDRDAQINPELTALRSELAAKVRELREHWGRFDRWRWMLRRVDESRLGEHLRLTKERRTNLTAILDEEADRRQQAREALAPFGINVPAITPMTDEHDQKGQ